MLGELVAGGLSLLGGIMGQDKTDDRQAAAQAFNADEARKTRDFQERMSSTAYQRGMLDMKTAGLNPILAYQKGPASSPSGATASTTFAPAGDVITPAVNSAQAARRLTAEIDNMVQTNENLKSQKMLTEMQTVREGAQVSNIAADTRNKVEVLKRLEKEAVHADMEKTYRESPIGQGTGYLGQFLRDLNPFGGNRALPSLKGN